MNWTWIMFWGPLEFLYTTWSTPDFSIAQAMQGKTGKQTVSSLPEQRTRTVDGIDDLGGILSEWW